MPNTELREAEMLAERLRREVEREGVTEGIPRFTVSIGLSEVNFCDGDDGADALAEALLRADQALYAAKRAGRNLVVRTADGTIFNHGGSTSSDGDSEK
jgi:GGDEF domain-containing protein